MQKKIKLLKELGLVKLGKTYQNFKKKRKEEISKRIRREKKEQEKQLLNEEKQKQKDYLQKLKDEEKRLKDLEVQRQ